MCIRKTYFKSISHGNVLYQLSVVYFPTRDAVTSYMYVTKCDVPHVYITIAIVTSNNNNNSVRHALLNLIYF